MKERAILATVAFKKNFKSDPQDWADELAELGISAGLEIADSFVFRQAVPNASLFLGLGKVQMIRDAAKKHLADVVIFQTDLSPSQQRNLEEELGFKTVDRTQLILDIFARRARSLEGKLQVELAQLQYLLPRLAGQGIYLSRQGGGVGTRGPGEQKLEVDRRRIRDRVTKLKQDLAGMQEKRITAIAKKKEKDLPLAALVGYTNAGKSSLFNLLVGEKVIVKDQQFSTLDTTTRLLELPSNQKALLVDTVGFVRNLPHHLIESFKATLEEVIHADVLFHVVDASREDLGEVLEAVGNVLKELEVQEKPTYLLLNKWDLVGSRNLQLKNLPLSGFKEIFRLSSVSGEGIQEFRDYLAAEFSEGRALYKILVPSSKMNLLSLLYEKGDVVHRADEAEGVLLKVWLSARLASWFGGRLGKALTAA